ncbi:MAG: PQQ-dependent sugar dehydrogenase, partial [Verrucomicrobia bacterium]|nr:PQQ-dependent sugar dehydrogenase [Verrucomicrobiota bacterium]
MKIIKLSPARVIIPFLLLHAQITLFGEDPYDPSRYEKEVLVPASNDALQLEVLPNGDIVFIEFWGAVKRWHANTGNITVLGRIPTHAKGEVGLLGMAVAKDFLKSGHLYVQFCPAENPGTMRISRFTAKIDRQMADTEVELLSWPYDTEHVFHMGGGLWMDGEGDLYIATGDNSHHSPGLPVDMRPGWKNWDSYRSAGNTRDHRGKILRIHPTADGSYLVPKDNLFPNGIDGLAEIYAMGIRNPFRITVDDSTGTLFIGDVGPNIKAELGIETAGYDEINATQVACNFGWPSFVGPNEALPVFDFDKNEVIEFFDPQTPRNYSPNNTGAEKLPPAQPALIWYPTLPSNDFPSLGSGGRSIMAGPVYHYDESNPSSTKLPKELDGRLFIYEWMRNWIKTVHLDSQTPKIEPFLPEGNLRRPIDMKIGPDDALYMIEYGDQWWENQDSQIVRLVYRRGNRTPVAKLSASETAGKHPLKLSFDASESYDADDDYIHFTWKVSGKKEGSGPSFEYMFSKPGNYELSLTATDPNGASNTQLQLIQVGNARPQLSFKEPAHGSFFDWGKEIPYVVDVVDEDSEPVNTALVAVQGQFL